MSGFLTLLAREQVLVDGALDAYLPAADKEPAVIHQAMRYSVFAGGKRLRPALTLAAARAVGGVPLAVLPAACAVELVHSYSLVHDDLPAMDNDDLRRGKPTSHRVFGEAVALMAGNALLTLAFDLLARRLPPDTEPQRALAVVAELAEACGTAGLIGGQVLDVTSTGAELGEAELERVHRAKTGALFRAAVRTGGLLGGATDEQLALLSAYADGFGLAFQITDDILDVTGQAERIGKAVGSDARNAKRTYVTVLGLETARRRAAQAAREAVDALSVFGPEADFLRQAAQFIVSREF